MTKDKIKQFELEQKEYGTEVALSNFIVLLASDLLKSVNVKSLKIQYNDTTVEPNY